MTTKVEKSLLVNVPVSVAYNQWTQFEEFPHFMGGVQKVTQLGENRLEWVAEILGVKRRWEAQILEQVPDQHIAWAATEGATNAGAVRFEDVGGGQSRVHLTLEYEPEGLVEKVGDALNIVEKQAESDLDRFKAFIEDEGYASGAWRGTIAGGVPAGTPGVEDATSHGDSGKAGLSGKAVAAAAGAVVAGVAAAMHSKKDSTSTDPATDVPPAVGDAEVADVEVVDVVVVDAGADDVEVLDADVVGHPSVAETPLYDPTDEHRGDATRL